MNCRHQRLTGLGRGTAAVLLSGAFGCAFADTSAPQAPVEYQNLLDAFEQAAALWNAPLVAVAEGLFWGLALIELCWVGFTLVLRGSDLNEFAWEVFKLIMFLGFFYQLILEGPAYSNAIIQSFQQAGNIAVAASGGTADINPSGILSLGLKTALLIMSTASVWHAGDSIGLIIGALVVMLCFAYIAAIYAVTLLETYIVIGASVLFYAFGGSRWSADIARRIFMYAFSAGAKLFMLQLIAGTAYVLISSWTTGYTNDNGSLLGLIGLSMMIALVSAMLPNIVQAVTSGASSTSLAPALAVASLAATAASGAAAAGSGLAGSAAASLGGDRGASGQGPRLAGDPTARDRHGLASLWSSLGSMGGTAEQATNLGGPMSGRSAGTAANPGIPPKQEHQAGMAARSLVPSGIKGLLGRLTGNPGGTASSSPGQAPIIVDKGSSKDE